MKYLVLLCALLFSGAAGAQGTINGGWVGTYQSGIESVTNPAFSRVDDRIDFTFTSVGPGGSLTPAFNTSSWSSFSARWAGEVIPTTTEKYTLSVSATGGIALYYRPHGTAYWRTLGAQYANVANLINATVPFTAGSTYDIEVHYWQTGTSGNVHFSWSSPTIAQKIVDNAIPVGFNTNPALVAEPGELFADVVKMSCCWSAAVDANDWPTADTTIELWSTSGLELDGTYAISFLGQASSITDVNSTGTLSNIAYNSSTNTTTATWTVTTTTYSANAVLKFTGTKRTPTSATNTGFTNLQVMRPISEGSTTSHPFGTVYTAEYEKLMSYATGERFMDYLATNSNRQANWTDRMLPTRASQFQAIGGYGFQGLGGSWEYLIMLANETGKDIYINIPLYASTDYFTKVAQMLKYGSDGVNPYTFPQISPAYPPLNSNLHIYIEYSNELWNSGLGTQYNDNITLATNEVNAGGSPLNYDGSTSSTVWAHRRTCNQLVKISNAFRSVWGNAAMGTTIRPAFMWDYGYTNGVATDGLHFMLGYYENNPSFSGGVNWVPNPEPPSYYFYGGGAAWYTNAVNDTLSTPAAIWASGITVPTTGTDSVIAVGYGLHLMGYEGNYVVGFSNPLQPAEVQANQQSGAQTPMLATMNQYFHLAGAGTAAAYPFIFHAVGGNQDQYAVSSPTIHEFPGNGKFIGLQQFMSGQHP